MPKNICLSIAAALSLSASSRVSLAAAQGTRAGADSANDELTILAAHAPSMLGAWVAGAHHSPFQTRTGIHGHRNFYLSSVRLAWSVGGDHSRSVTGMYFIDLVPAALSTDMPEYIWNSRCRPETLCPGATPIPHNAYAVGISPIGWALVVGNGQARLTMEASGGGLWFTRRVPDPVATRFNFTASAGPWLELRLTPAQSLRLGYLWHHTSNGGRGKVNPGLNSGILAAGLLWHAAARRD